MANASKDCPCAVDRPRLLRWTSHWSALDAKLREEMQIELINLQKEVGITFVYGSTHQAEALALSHRIAVMSAGQVEQLDKLETYLQLPAQPLCGGFHWPVQCTGQRGVKAIHGDGSMTIAIKGCGEMGALARDGVKVGQQGWLALRPEKIKLDRELPELPNEAYFMGRVHDCLYMGDADAVYRRGGRRRAHRSDAAQFRPRPGQAV